MTTPGLFGTTIGKTPVCGVDFPLCVVTFVTLAMAFRHVSECPASNTAFRCGTPFTGNKPEGVEVRIDMLPLIILWM